MLILVIACVIMIGIMVGALFVLRTEINELEDRYEALFQKQARIDQILINEARINQERLDNLEHKRSKK